MFTPPGGEDDADEADADDGPSSMVEAFKQDDAAATCPECGRDLDDPEAYTFCPRCGADLSR